MKKLTLFLILILSNFTVAQSTYEISWDSVSEIQTVNLTIEIGDTVKWIWSDGQSKSVTSLPGGREVFDSGVIQGRQKSFSHTFLKPGVTRYENEVNPMMNGAITVVQNLSAQDKFLKNLNYYPNPVTTHLYLTSIFPIDSFEIYNVLGTLVMKGKGNTKKPRIDMSALNSGMYFIKITCENIQTTLKITKY